ncbi:hypothetical protein pb186bvf_020048 [Paramecium bursaria]
MNLIILQKSCFVKLRINGHCIIDKYFIQFLKYFIFPKLKEQFYSFLHILCQLIQRESSIKFLLLLYYKIINYTYTKQIIKNKKMIQEGIQDIWYNLTYILNTYLQSPQSVLKGKHLLTILGQIVGIQGQNTEQVIQKLKDTIGRTLWMTYRKNFPRLLNTNYVSDTGWGCMIRVGQMALAQVLKKHLKNHGDKRDDELVNIAQAFADDDKNESLQIDQYLKRTKDEPLIGVIIFPFSIQKISYLARKDFQLEPGSWYKPNNILYILETLHNSFPIRGSENLRMLVFNDSCMFKQEIVAKMDGRFSIALFVLTRIGLEQPNPDYLDVLDQIMELKYFQGIVGGKPKKAFYIIGRIADQYIYLDPHYVQESTTQDEIIRNPNTFKCQDIQLIPRNNIDTSMGLAFYLRNPQELEDFWIQINNLKRQHENFFIGLADESPQQIQFHQQEDDDIFVVE